jgi:hypothetical protein
VRLHYIHTVYTVLFPSLEEQWERPFLYYSLFYLLLYFSLLMRIIRDFSLIKINFEDFAIALRQICMRAAVVRYVYIRPANARAAKAWFYRVLLEWFKLMLIFQACSKLFFRS